MAEQRLYLVDATAFCYRAFYALGDLATSFGQPTGAVYGFVNMINKVLKDHRPDYLAVCFDVSRDTFRQKKFADYKIQRPPMPDKLSGQIPLIKEITRAMGIALLEKEGFEADDIIATLGAKAKEAGLKVTVVSSDKDMLQLVDENTVVFNPYDGKGIFYDEDNVRQRLGVTASQVPDMIALMGDDVDNIPGVPGIGEKTAASLIKRFGSVEALLDRTDDITQDKLSKAIKEHVQNIRLSKELAILDKNVDVEFRADKFKILQADFKELYRLFKYLEFKGFLKTLTARQADTEDEEAVEIKDGAQVKINGPIGQMVLYYSGDGDIICAVNEAVFRLSQPEDRLRKALSDPKVRKIGWDLKKIKVGLSNRGIVLAGEYFDVALAAYLIDPSKGDYSLAELAWTYLKEALSEKSLQGVKAIELILKLVPKLEEELSGKSLFELFYGVEMPLVEVLAEMEINGIKLDLEVLGKLSSELEQRLIKLIDEIYGVCGCQFNINSPKQLREILFEQLKLPVVKRSKTGPSTDEEVLKVLSAQHKLPALLLEYRQLSKLKSTYVDTLPAAVDKRTGSIHTSFNQTATETGRLSSSNPNLQNLPIKTDIGSNIRRAIIASGARNYLVSCDYSQIELRILAHICGDENLISAFKEDKDVHRATAALIYTTSEDNVTDAMRETAKRVNFGIIYGLSAFGLSRDLGISVEDAQNFIDAYFLRYPRVKSYIEEQVKLAQKDSFVKTILGRRRYIPQINNRNQSIRGFAERQAINTPIQGSASDLIKLAMINVHRYLKDNAKATKMLIQIHDELVFDVPEAELAEFCATIKEKMEKVMVLSVPLKVAVKRGRNWLDMQETCIDTKIR